VTFLLRIRQMTPPEHCSHSMRPSLKYFGHFVVGYRLAGSETADQGRLEIEINGVWGTVCDDSFNDSAAQVACSGLGFG